ncbi:hypothetical protein ACHAWF_007111, partial [Thalassiosira exigua]
TSFLVLIKGGAKSKYQQRREIWRNSKCPASYKRHNISYRFMLTMPTHQNIDVNSHNQGARASKAETSNMAELRDELMVHKDMVFLLMKDVYTDFSFNTLRTFQWAVDRGMNEDLSVVVLHDDELCLRPSVLRSMCKEATRANSSLYAGTIYWKEADYEIQNQKGLDGSFTPYFDGHLYALSRDLVTATAYHPETVFTSMNLGFVEDFQVGMWVRNQVDWDDLSKEIMYLHNSSLLWEVVKPTSTTPPTKAAGKVNYGGHSPSSCAEFPQDKGA